MNSVEVHDTSHSEDGQGLVDGGTGSWELGWAIIAQGCAPFWPPPMVLCHCVALSARVGAQCCCYPAGCSSYNFQQTNQDRVEPSNHLQEKQNSFHGWSALIRTPLFRSQGMARWSRGWRGHGGVCGNACMQCKVGGGVRDPIYSSLGWDEYFCAAQEVWSRSQRMYFEWNQICHQVSATTNSSGAVRYVRCPHNGSFIIHHNHSND